LEGEILCSPLIAPDGGNVLKRNGLGYGGEVSLRVEVGVNRCIETFYGKVWADGGELGPVWIVELLPL
jgi:hypothetical protein